MKKILFILSFSSILAWSCSKPAENQFVEEKIKVPETATDSVPDSVSGATYSTGDNSMTSVDWPGTYFATLPCGRCEGIEMWVTLKSDGTYALNTNYLGLNDALEEEFTGKFSWDKNGGIVTLEGLKGTYPGKFKVGENRIWYLDADGKQKTGPLADQYILTKK
ncbi:MAG: copper resistance protein NlpE [Algoriphagus sp.]|nr:copper resistance protein NlpE [Algoriphagus sp.]